MTKLKILIIAIVVIIFIMIYYNKYYEFLENENSVKLEDVEVLSIFKNMKTKDMIDFFTNKKIKPEEFAENLQKLKISSNQLLKEENAPKIMTILYNNKMITI
jgi:hypothetical protein